MKQTRVQKKHKTCNAWSPCNGGIPDNPFDLDPRDKAVAKAKEIQRADTRR